MALWIYMFTEGGEVHVCNLEYRPKLTSVMSINFFTVPTCTCAVKNTSSMAVATYADMYPAPATSQQKLVYTGSAPFSHILSSYLRTLH